MVNDQRVSNSTLKAPEPPGAFLQSNDTRGLLDVVDNLRSQGISRYIDLPEIIVVGEQSSGKSSVLEAISGLTFPSKDNLCTRFATELVLRRGLAAPIKISIVLGNEEQRTEGDKETLRNFHDSVSYDDLRLDHVVESAKTAMGINDTTKVFSSDILRLEVSGPNQPHLTLVDLPGLFQAGSRSQSDAEIGIVKSLVLSYMKRPRSIILAVVSAKNDFNNQPITRHAREIDPEGMRTLGLITKPDTLDKGSDSERFYIDLAQNRDVKFRLGWHVLRNRDYPTRDFSLEERNRAEEEFFANGVWRSLHSSQVGVRSLKPRLSKILKDQILAQLPDVLTQIQDGLQDCTKRLEILGTSRNSLQEQRRYLLQVSQSFSNLIKATTDGSYSHSFFGNASTNEGYQKRLRAVLQNTLTEFADAMRKDGHTYKIVDDDLPKGPSDISRQDYIAKVHVLLSRSRGRELPGTFDPMIIGQLFREQREPWENMVEAYVREAFDAVNHVVRAVLQHTTDETTSDKLLRRQIHPKLEGLKNDVQRKVNEILAPHVLGHPITYNHYLTENVQKAQEERRTREMKNSLEDLFGADYTTREIDVALDVNVNSLLRLIVTKSKKDMNNYASSTATDFMEAYYKVALKKVVDDISVLAIEACLIARLPTLFSPEMVLDIDDEMVTAVAAEDEECSAERAQCNEKRQILEEGLRELKSVQKHSPVHFRDKQITTQQNGVSGVLDLDGNHLDEASIPDMMGDGQPPAMPGLNSSIFDEASMMVTEHSQPEAGQQLQAIEKVWVAPSWEKKKKKGL